MLFSSHCQAGSVDWSLKNSITSNVVKEILLAAIMYFLNSLMLKKNTEPDIVIYMWRARCVLLMCGCQACGGSIAVLIARVYICQSVSMVMGNTATN